MERKWVGGGVGSKAAGWKIVRGGTAVRSKAAVGKRMRRGGG